MIKGGIGGARTITGLKFEKRVDLRKIFNKSSRYSIKGNDLFFDKEKVAEIYKKNEVYSSFFEKLNIDWELLISKRLLPDNSIFVIKNNTWFIIEIKFQKVAGSVDEKLQTCDFKKKQYQKLVIEKGIKVEYIYILIDWFKSKEYVDVLNYVDQVGCHYFFKELPLEFLGLPVDA